MIGDDAISIGGERLVRRDDATPQLVRSLSHEPPIELTFTVLPPNPKDDLAVAVAMGLAANPESN